MRPPSGSGPTHDSEPAGLAGPAAASPREDPSSGASRGPGGGGSSGSAERRGSAFFPASLVPPSGARWAGPCWAVAVALALGLPPEVHPVSGALIGLALCASLLLARRGPRPMTLLLAVLFIVYQLAVSLAPGASVEVLASLLLVALTFAVGREVSAEGRGPLLAMLPWVGGALGALALAQRLSLMAQSAAAARQAGLPLEIILRLEQGRPFATHVVPAALGGALVLAAAAAAASWSSTRRRWLLVIPAAGIACGLLLSASIGALGGALVAIAVVFGRKVRPGRARGAALTLLLVVVALAVTALRPAPLFELSRPDNPLRLRWGNWRGCVAIAAERPVAGTGLGSFASLYPARRRPGDSETRFAHNSWLQLAVEGGLPMILLLAGAAAGLWRRLRSPGAGAEPWLLAGVLAFVVHNLADFTAYLPGVAVPAAALAALLYARPRPRADRARARGALVLAAAAVACAGLYALEAASRHELETASWQRAAGAERAASASARRAVNLAPWNRRRLVQAGGPVLAGGSRADLAWLRERAARTVEADPGAPGPRHLLGRLLLEEGRPVAAWLELRSAQRRHPASPDLKRTIEQVERSFRAAGAEPERRNREGARNPPPPPEQARWQPWDDLVLAVGIALALAAVGSGLRRRDLAAAAFAVAGLAIVSSLGEGGALPGARLARAGLLAVAWLALVKPLERGQREVGDRATVLAGGLLLLIAAAAASLSPAPFASRDGWFSCAAALLLLLVTAALARRYEHWTRLSIEMLALGAGAQAALWLTQRGLLLAGSDLRGWLAPLAADNPVRPAADFLHPGHLGTWLVAAALALAGTALAERLSWPRLVVACVLLVVGLAGGGRATLLALASGGAVFAWLSPRREWRRALGWGLAGALALGLAAVGWRFAHGDPYAWTRPKIWSAALEALTARPLAGYGPGGFSSAAAAFVFEDPGPVARFARGFHGPHSDPLALLLSLGIPGGAVLALLSLAGARRILAALRRGATPVHLGALAGLVALVTHGLVDDYLTERPAAWVAAALLAGPLLALAPIQRPLRLPRAARLALAASVLAGLVAGEALPWAADRVRRAGRTEWAVALDPRSPAANLDAARRSAAAGDLPGALDHAARARRSAPLSTAPLSRAALLLEDACRGGLALRETCEQASAFWSAALARDPRDVFTRRARARLSAATRSWEAAETDLRLALATEPAFLGARADLARLRLETGDREGARRELDELEAQARRLDGARPLGSRGRALLELETGEVSRLRARLAHRGAREE